MNDVERQILQDRLSQLHNQMNRMADEEARSALVNGWAASGALFAKKMAIIEESEEILSKLMDDHKNANRT